MIIERSDLQGCAFPGNSVDPGGVVSTLYRHGVALIRGALPTDGLAFLRGGLTEWYRYRRDELAAGRGNAADFLHLLCNGVGLAGCYSSPLIEILGESVFRDCAVAYFGDGDLVIPVHHLLFRVRDVAVDQAALTGGQTHGFHQDHDLIPAAFPLNAWIPLMPVDESCTGLSFVFPYRTEVHRLPFDLESYLAAHDGFVWSPDLLPGDILLFHRHTIHGSFFKTGVPDTRMSVEFRVGMTANSPDSYTSYNLSFNCMAVRDRKTLMAKLQPAASA